MKNKTIHPFLLHKPVVIGCCCTKRGQKQEEAPAPVFIVGAAIAYNASDVCDVAVFEN